MSAHTVVSVVPLSINAGSGVKTSLVKITGSASYDTGGSVLDLSDYFGDEVRSITGQAQGAVAYGPQYVPDTGNAPATCKVFLADADGVQAINTFDASGVTFDLIVTGTDA